MSVASVVLEGTSASLREYCEIKHGNFVVLLPDPFQTNSIDRLCTQSYQNTVKNSWLYLYWLIGLKNHALFVIFERSSLVLGIKQIICLLLCVFLTTTTLDKI